MYPARDRIGFDDAILSEEGRQQLGGPDDYDMYLASRGHVGEAYLHGMSNNEYDWRPWHLDEDCHVTNWATRVMCTTIKRRDPTRPAFWYLLYTHPHPPLVPLQSYVERYRGREIDAPVIGEWASQLDALPPALRDMRSYYRELGEVRLAEMRRAFYALCTHIDQQLRVVIGTLSEEKLLDNTIILFTSDHGDMLGNHGLYGKRLMYESAAWVPVIVVDRAGSSRVSPGRVENRIVGLQNLMPTLFDMAGLPIPETCDGSSMLSEQRRAYLYGEAMNGVRATRMVCDERYKLIWYPVPGPVQLFDLVEVPDERYDVATDPSRRLDRERLEGWLIAQLYGGDLAAVHRGKLGGIEVVEKQPGPNRGLSGQRGLHYPQIPLESDPTQVVGAA